MRPDDQPSITLRVGMISAAAALVGSVVGGAGAYIAAYEQARSAETVAYRAVSAQAYQDYVSTYDEVDLALTQLEQASPEEFSSKLEAARAASEELRTRGNRLRIVGKTEIAQAGFQLRVEVRDYLNDVAKHGPDFLEDADFDNPKRRSELNKKATRLTELMNSDVIPS